jgi:hypothetical protein
VVVRAELPRMPTDTTLPWEAGQLKVLRADAVWTFGAQAFTTVVAPVTVTVAVAVWAVLATEVAVTVQLPAVAGDVYVTATAEALEVGETAPQVAVQVTPRLAPSFVTVAVKFCVLFRPMLVVVGEMFTLMTGAAVTVMAEVAILVASVVLLAVSVTAELVELGAV